MINLVVALVAGALLGGVMGIWLTPLEAILPGMVSAVLVYFVIARRTGNRINNIMLAAQKELQGMATQQNPQVARQYLDRAVAIMERARPYARWQFFVDKMINSQVGSLYYIQEQYKKAQPLLENSDPRQWIPRVMLALMHYRNKDFTRMDQVFEDAAKYNKKQGLLYSAWAWCHWKNDNTERALQILSRGDGELEGKDDKLKQNLLNLQNGKKMKMKGYGNDWYQFLLEKPQVQQQQIRYR
ncbi:MAG: hypothetical protein HY904_07050 [Deltaproteobacteria bacterium]|nr:hypothetical protein [Deltaproteobacteria bacterium]